jgi:CheY-like chemotaxis protein/HPt (histidine-containing phosphotransfer) domain-containing protein
MLEKAGYSVAQAENGNRAIELAARERFGVILMDIQMPGLDGFATTAELRRRMSDVHTVPIIALTANVMSDRVEAFRSAGMDDYLAKPIQRSVLLAKVEQWMAARPTLSLEAVAVDHAGFDRETFEEVVDLLGLARVQTSLGEITDRLSAVAGMAADRRALGREAHALVSLAGVLGFNDLVHACRDLERMCQGQTDLGDALAAVHRASVLCLRAVADHVSPDHRDHVSDQLVG